MSNNRDISYTAIFVVGDSPLADLFYEKLKNLKNVKYERYKEHVKGLKEQYQKFCDKYKNIEKRAYFLYDDDSYNVKALLSVKSFDDVKFVASMHQSTMGEKLKRHFRTGFEPFNPSALAAKNFVDSALFGQAGTTKESLKKKANTSEEWFGTKLRPQFKMDPLVKKALLFIGSIMLLAATFFHFYNDLPWLDSFYFVVTTMTTVGYGDYSLKDYDTLSKTVGIFLMLLSITSSAIVFALVSDGILRKRREIAYGVSKYSGEGHVIVIGGGSVGYQTILDLKRRGERPVLLDKTMDTKYSKDIIDLGVPFLIGDARNETMMICAGVEGAKAVICVTQDDLTNMEVGLDVKNMLPDRRVVLRMFDQQLSKSLRESVNIKYSHSMSHIASEKLIENLTTHEKIQ